MDISDFEGLTKFKIFIPALYILSWISMFSGPSLFPVPYQKYCIIMILYLLLRVMIVTGIMVHINIKTWSLFNRVDSGDQEQNQERVMEGEQEIYHGFIIPNYKEQIELLSETLDFLAAQKRAKEQFLIFLGMEAHEPGSEDKAKQLVENYKNSFRVIDYTIHQIRQNEQKGKASNVSWCAQHLQPIFEKNMIDQDTVFLTIIDADSWAPDLYYDLVEEHIQEHFQDRFKFIYQPPQLFTRNNFQVPLTTRVYDITHCFAHMGNLFSFFDFTFPLSNYTLSYNLVKRMGFWDTCPDAIGEDFHTTQKAYWKTGDITTVPIYVPFNQVNISTGRGYWEDMKARFWQAERHARGVADVAYNMKMIFNNPFRIKHLLVFYLVLETFLITATLPWICISLNYQSRILFQYEKPSPELYNDATFSYLFTVMSIFGSFAYLCFQVYKRRVNRIIYKQENESIFRLIEYFLLFVVLFFTISVPTFLIAAFSCLFGNQEYVVADKKNVVKKSIQQS